MKVILCESDQELARQLAAHGYTETPLPSGLYVEIGEHRFVMPYRFTEEDVAAVWSFDYDPDLELKPVPYTQEELREHEYGKALRRVVTLHQSHRAVPGHATDESNYQSMLAKSQSPIIARFAGYLATSETRRWIGLSFRES